MQAKRDEPAVLSIGLNVGGTSGTNRRIVDALADFQRAVVRERDKFDNGGLRVNLVFNDPGPFFRTDFEGVVISRYRRKDSHLLALAAVPIEVSEEQVSDYLVGVLQNLMDMIRQYVKRRKIADSLDCLEGVMDHMIATRADWGIKRG
jgi:hypothetical protein